MKWLLYTNSFKTRLWLAFALAITLSLVVSGVTSQFMASRVLERKSTDLNQSLINKSTQALEEKLRKVRTSTLTFTMNQPFLQLVAAVREHAQLSDYERFALGRSIENTIFQLKLIEPSIKTVLIRTPIGEFYAEQDKRIATESAEEHALNERIEAAESVPIWTESHVDPLFEGGRRVLTFATRPVSSVASDNIHVLINVEESYLRRYLTENLGEDSGDMIVYNASGAMAFDAPEDLRGMAEAPDFQAKLTEERGYFEYKQGGNVYLANYSRVSFPDNWIVVNVQNKADLYREINRIKWITAGTIILFGVLAIFLTKGMTSFLLRPMIKLQHLMKRVEQNDLLVRYESKYDDEFSRLGQRFNRMLDEIGALIENLKDAETNKRKAEIKALQSQIDPHFLYNTLNTILWKSESNEHEDARDMIVALSLLFRLGLNNGRERTTIRQEIEHVTQYLLIQQLCYEDLFRYTMDVPAEVMELPSLKLLLQPLVENSILHGFKDMVTDGRIMIRIGKTPKHLSIEVEDNGQGFDTAAVSLQLDGAESKREQGGYALRNVYNRLMLYYGPEAAMEMESVPYERTVVKLLIPLTGGETT